MVKILIAATDKKVKNGLKKIIHNAVDNNIIEHAVQAELALKKIKREHYQLIILDVDIPGADTVALLANIIILKPEAKILIFSNNIEEGYATKFLQTGAMGYIGKPSPEREIKRAIQSVLNHKRYLSPALLENLVRGYFRQKTREPF